MCCEKYLYSPVSTTTALLTEILIPFYYNLQSQDFLEEYTSYEFSDPIL